MTPICRFCGQSSYSGATKTQKPSRQSKEMLEYQNACSMSCIFNSIRQCAELVQSCPASEAHHHAQPGGLLAHILESCAASLQMRKGRILPVGESLEISSRLADLYTYAVFAGALLHDIAKPLTDQTIQIYDRKKEKIKQGGILCTRASPK